jgi:sugar (pentulose or hexulose) kinase
MQTPVIAIFDAGKTNKKLFLFDEQYKILLERTCLFPETTDEDGDACEDLEKLEAWVADTWQELQNQDQFRICAINCSAYGASFIHIGREGRPIAPLYNYLKPYPAELQQKFYSAYGGEVAFSTLTASPVLGSLNSGMQLYRIKERQPDLFARIKYSLHLPQYLSFLLTGTPCSEITSIGCHTNLWNFSEQHYHEWVYREGIIEKLPPVLPLDGVLPVNLSAALENSPGGPECVAGIGLHDSSSAMIPYLASFREPFVLISTGTWCISMNSFNEAPLTAAELKKDCLCYLSYRGRPVKASRLFAGYEHGQQVGRLADYFHKAPDFHATVAFDPEIVAHLQEQAMREPLLVMQIPGGHPISGQHSGGIAPETPIGTSIFSNRELTGFRSYEEAYHCLLMDIMKLQVESTQLVLQGTDVKRIFVDGGFSKNAVYMHLLAAAFPHIEVFAASIPQATAMGAALAIHSHWNTRPLPGDIIELKYYK